MVLQRRTSLAEYRLFYRVLLQKRPIILRSLLIVAVLQRSTTKDVVLLPWFSKEVGENILYHPLHEDGQERPIFCKRDIYFEGAY